MQEQLISFDTAKLAKNKKFSAETHYWYNENDSKPKGGTAPGTFYSNHATRSDLYSAPTQSLLQKWLRDGFNFHIELSLFNDSKFRVEIWKFKPSYRMHVVNIEYLSDKLYDTYEEALEDGLFEALKLI